MKESHFILGKIYNEATAKQNKIQFIHKNFNKN